MSGHSKWATIRRKKEKIDSARGKVFTKLIKEITVAARMGGGDENSNPRLRAAVLAAKASNMPQDNIKRAIMKGTGELPGVIFEEYVYEGYGPGGVAIMLEATTDNKNRTVGEVRHFFSKYGGNLGENGSVSWMFESKGIILVPAEKVDEDELFEIATEAGAEDMDKSDEMFEISVLPEEFENVRKTLEEKGIEMSSAEITKIPQTTVKLEESKLPQLLKLYDALEEHDDVSRVFINLDMEDIDLG